MNWELLQNYITNNCSKEERIQVEEWADKDPSNRQLLDELEKIWKVSPEKELSVKSERAWQRFKQDKDIDERDNIISSSNYFRTPENSWSGSYSKIHMMGRVAALLLVAVLIGLGYKYYVSDGADAVQSEVAMSKLVTEQGEKAGIKFSDGSRVVLNAETQLRFPKKFVKHERKVILSGEAYFDINPQSEKPFIVKTNSATVRVMGTKFNVKSWDHNSKIGVTVREGEVSVRTRDTASSSQKILLKKNQHLVYDERKKSLKVEQVDADKFMLWLNDGFYFQNTPFSEVVDRLEQRFKVDIKVKEQDLLSVPFTGEFRQEDLSKILDVISKSMEITIVNQNNKIIVKEGSNKEITN